MNVAVVIPWRPGCPWREQALRWVQARYTEFHSSWPVYCGLSGAGPFSRTQAILDGVRWADADRSVDVLVVADGDVWTEGVEEAVAHAAEVGWAIPHRLVHRLSRESTERVLAGDDWRGLPLSHDNPQDCRPYVGHETGTLVVLRRDVFEEVPPDPRFVGWGQEDGAWSLALRRIIGPPWRGSPDLVHLWHPPQQRLTRRVGSVESRALLNRYRRARTPEQTRALIAESRLKETTS